MQAEHVYSRILDFYARQMRTIDGGDAAGWAATFTEDGVFASNGLPEPVRGRAAIEAGTAVNVAAREAQGVTHRHVLSALAVEPRGTDEVFARSYVLVLENRAGHPPRPFVSTVLEDVLVHAATGSGADWQVRSRTVLRDDRPSIGTSGTGEE
ncbi:nuclear transport factor 2 family protein [Kitasatospora sp. NBC_01287]|uniref:nuclear transport factor 2 family protein n=1 Tax=Kitasatospora sp. NBC_01287 TaxID=2903573 RepID=UPI00225416CC|nr:nuclear transport factor 2 family protein [Kitasatospora sp. NBC_01287]MCX4748902.1 nuclear transport factor 2 family protein [Kitasatospora sp. NBC_01287]